MEKAKSNPENGAGKGTRILRPKRSLSISEKGLNTPVDMIRICLSLISDVNDGSQTPQVSNAVANLVGKVVRVVEMQHKYGTKQLTLKQSA